MPPVTAPGSSCLFIGSLVRWACWLIGSLDAWLPTQGSAEVGDSRRCPLIETRNYGGGTAWLVLEQFASLTSVFSSQLWLLKMQPAGKGRLPGRPPQATWNCREEWSESAPRPRAPGTSSWCCGSAALVQLRLLSELPPGWTADPGNGSGPAKHKRRGAMSRTGPGLLCASETLRDARRWEGRVPAVMVSWDFRSEAENEQDSPKKSATCHDCRRALAHGHSHS